MEQADAWELLPGENGPESAAPGATTARHFINELVKNAATGSETAGEKKTPDLPPAGPRQFSLRKATI